MSPADVLLDSAAAWALGAAAPPDEFDLDARWEAAFPDGLDAFLPTTGHEPGQTCDTHAATCPNTCPNTCPATCANTCPATCRGTCHATCRATCQATCRHTCDDEGFSCGGTCANTHCFTCRSGCQPP